MINSIIFEKFGGKFELDEDTLIDAKDLYKVIGDSSEEPLHLDNSFVRLFGNDSDGVELSIEYLKKAKCDGKDELYDLSWAISDEEPDWVHCRLKYQLLIGVSSTKDEKYCYHYGKNYRSKTILQIDYELCVCEETDIWSVGSRFSLDGEEINKYFSFESEVPNYIVDFMDLLREETNPENIYSYFMRDEEDVNVVDCHIFNNFRL